jgi:hypothetical protein
MTERTLSQPLPNGISTVDRTLSQPLADVTSTVRPDVTSAATGRYVNRDSTVEMPLQGDYQEDLSAGIQTSEEDFCRFDYAARTAASSAPGARGLEFADVPHVNQELKTEQVYPMRPKGKVVQREKPVASGSLPNQEQPQPQKQNEPRPRGVITKGEKPLPPNWICYPDAFKGLVDEHGNWLGKGKIPACRVCQGLLHPKENHVCPGYQPKYPMLPSTKLVLEERKALRHAAREQAGDWDDDQYDPTTSGDIPRNPDEEDSGVILDWMDEDSWIAAKRRGMGFSPYYDPPEFDPEED